MIYFCVKFQKDPQFGVNLTFVAPWLPWQRPPFWIYSTPQKLPHTTVDIPTKLHEVWSKKFPKKSNPPFLFPWQLRQNMSNRFRFFFCLSRSTRCGCCSYQDSSISAMIIFVFFIFLAFWQFPWQRQPFWKNQPLKAQLHMAYDIPTRFHKVWSRHLREMCQTNFWRKKERKKEEE
jgi:hypothetical protein